MKNYKNLFDLSSRTVLINGGLGLIGEEISKLMISLNAKVIIIDKNKSAVSKFQKKYNSNKVLIHSLDSSDIFNLEGKINNILSKNKINIFINTTYPKDEHWINNSFERISYKSLQKNVELNTTSFIWFPKIVADNMVKQKIKGSIIQLNSIYGLRGQNNEIYKKTDLSNNLTYSYVKGGLSNYVKQMASYYGKYNIRVHILLIGLFAI